MFTRYSEHYNMLTVFKRMIITDTLSIKLVSNLGIEDQGGLIKLDRYLNNQHNEPEYHKWVMKNNIDIKELHSLYHIIMGWFRKYRPVTLHTNIKKYYSNSRFIKDLVILDLYRSLIDLEKELKNALSKGCILTTDSVLIMYDSNVRINSMLMLLTYMEDQYSCKEYISEIYDRLIKARDDLIYLCDKDVVVDRCIKYKHSRCIFEIPEQLKGDNEDNNAR